MIHNLRRGREINRLEAVVLPHARMQSNADGYQTGWHAALTRLSEGDTVAELRELVPEPSAALTASPVSAPPAAAQEPTE